MRKEEIEMELAKHTDTIRISKPRTMGRQSVPRQLQRMDSGLFYQQVPGKTGCGSFCRLRHDV